MLLAVPGVQPPRCEARPAQPARAAAHSRMKLHFNQGDVLYRLGKFRKALDEYKRALEFQRHPAILFNIGQCHRQLGQWKQALFSYELFLSERPNAPNRAEVETWIQDLKRRIATAEAAKATGRVSITTTPEGALVYVDHLAGRPAGKTPVVLTLRQGKHVLLFRKANCRPLQRVVHVRPHGILPVDVALPRIVSRLSAPTTGQVSITSSPEGAAAYVDRPSGKPAGKTPVVLTLSPGEHVIFLRAPGHRDQQQVISVRPGKITTATVTLARLHPAVPAPKRSASRYVPYKKRWWFKMGLAFSIILAAATATSGSLYLTFYKRYWDGSSSVHDLSTYKGLKIGGLVTDVLLGATVLSVAATVTGAIIVWRRGKREKREKRHALHVLPSCGPRGCYVALTGRF